MKIAIVSFNQIWENKHENMISCIAYIKKAVSLNSEIIIFPEMTLTGFSMKSHEIAECIDNSETIDFFKSLAKEYAITITFGMVLISPQKPTNNLIVISPLGKILVNYAKIHPFSFLLEDKYYSKGNELAQCIINNIPFGFTICYDLRFPEIFQALSKQSEIIVTIANWPEARKDHWETLLKARAIENQCVCIGVNRIGEDGNGITYTKSSSVFNQSGQRIQSEISENELHVFDINTSQINEERQRFPLKNDRRIELYKTVL